MHEVTQTLTEHYEGCLARHGATAQGMDWGENIARLALRFDAIGRAIGLDAHDRKLSLLDVGCGCGLLLDHLQSHWPSRVEYSGMDASAKMIAAARKAHPGHRWMSNDILESDCAVTADWVIANGLLTEKRNISHERMISYAQAVLIAMFNRCREGIVFNVLSSHVNYQESTLFYWNAGEVLSFCVQQLSRHVTIHHDLEMYEYYCSVRRAPWSRES